jgi:hypothetical protein
MCMVPLTIINCIFSAWVARFAQAQTPLMRFVHMLSEVQDVAKPYVFVGHASIVPSEAEHEIYRVPMPEVFISRPPSCLSNLDLCRFWVRCLGRCRKRIDSAVELSLAFIGWAAQRDM